MKIMLSKIHGNAQIYFITVDLMVMKEPLNYRWNLGNR